MKKFKNVETRKCSNPPPPKKVQTEREREVHVQGDLDLKPYGYVNLMGLVKAPVGLYSPEGRAINKGNIYISETSPREVGKAYLGQFEGDLTQFLQCRSQEVVSNGLMLFTLRGRPSSSNLATWQPWELKLLSQAVTSLVSKVTTNSAQFKD